MIFISFSNFVLILRTLCNTVSNYSYANKWYCLLLLLLLLRKRTCNHNKLSVLSKDAWSANIYSQSRSISVPVANELMNSLMGKWFCLFIQKSIHKMNNPIFVFSLDSIIECRFDYCFLKNYTFHKSTPEFCFFFFFF